MNRMRRVPWWVYVVTIGVLNVARQIAFPPSEVGTGATVGLFFAVLAVSFAVITALGPLFAPRRRQ
ncbi:hypothetical protein [Streptomyces sp. CA-111067]|uniref:hypothetical protein n=1 Tax=Streptomyces sp. CA-111067 TaxID=3240046 RepID=UPI003D96B3D0